jgi:hypothetical protein
MPAAAVPEHHNDGQQRKSYEQPDVFLHEKPPF